MVAFYPKEEEKEAEKQTTPTSEQVQANRYSLATLGTRLCTFNTTLFCRTIEQPAVPSYQQHLPFMPHPLMSPPYCWQMPYYPPHALPTPQCVASAAPAATVSMVSSIYLFPMPE